MSGKGESQCERQYCSYSVVGSDYVFCVGGKRNNTKTWKRVRVKNSESFYRLSKGKSRVTLLLLVGVVCGWLGVNKKPLSLNYNDAVVGNFYIPFKKLPLVVVGCFVRI